jgi:hypothetical protein
MAKVTASDLPTRIGEDGVAIFEGKGRVFSDETLRSVTSFDEAFTLAQETFGGVIDASDEIGSGFDLLDTDAKDSLTGVPFVILEMAFHHSDQYAQEFVSVVAVTEHNRRVIFNDGSTGIYAQLHAVYERTGRTGGILVKGGLRRSDYPANEERPAGTTYYLAV